jgi:hypothetical protein
MDPVNDTARKDRSLDLSEQSCDNGNRPLAKADPR